MAIFNMVQGKVPMTYRGTKTKLLAHFDNAANLAETAIYMNSGGAAILCMDTIAMFRASIVCSGSYCSCARAVPTGNIPHNSTTASSDTTNLLLFFPIGGTILILIIVKR